MAKRRFLGRTRSFFHATRVGTSTFFGALAKRNQVKVKQTPPVIIFEVIVVLFLIKLIFDYLV